MLVFGSFIAYILVFGSFIAYILVFGSFIAHIFVFGSFTAVVKQYRVTNKGERGGITERILFIRFSYMFIS